MKQRRGGGGVCTLKNWKIDLMGHLRDNIFVLDTHMSDPAGHLLRYLILAFNYSEGYSINIYSTVLVLNEVCIEI